MTEFRYDLDHSYPRDFGITPSQTVGPYLHIGLTWEDGSDVVPEGVEGAITIRGCVYDGAGEPIPDALLEIWQADQHGQVSRAEGSLRRDGYTFTGFGRAAVDANGHYSFTTVRPGPTHVGATAFIAMTVFARGLTNRLFTRIYLPSDEAAIEAEAQAFEAGLRDPETQARLARFLAGKA